MGWETVIKLGLTPSLKTPEMTSGVAELWTQYYSFIPQTWHDYHVRGIVLDTEEHKTEKGPASWGSPSRGGDRQ